MSERWDSGLVADFSPELANVCDNENESTHITDSSDHRMIFIWGSFNWSLSIFDAKTSILDKIDIGLLGIDQMLDQYGSKCLLPEGSLFYHNGLITVIINSEYQIKCLPSHPCKVWNAYAVYKDDCIYMFGGDPNTSFKFNIAENRWISLTSMPISVNHYTTGAIFKQYILLGSMSSNDIIYYDTIIDSFNNISSINLKNWCAKAFFVENETAYIMNFSQYIFRSTDHLITWENIGDCTLLDCSAPITSTPLTYNHTVYFANYFGIYSFNLKENTIKKLKSLPYN